MIPVSPLGLRPLAPHGQSYCLAGSSTPRTPVACRSSLARLWVSLGLKEPSCQEKMKWLLIRMSPSSSLFLSLSLSLGILWSFSTYFINQVRRLRASLVAQSVKNLPAVLETRVRSLGREDPLEEEMATPSSILAWRITWIEEPGGLQSMGSQRVGHD